MNARSPFITQDGTSLVRHPITGAVLTVVPQRELERRGAVAALQRQQALQRWDTDGGAPAGGRSR